MHFGVLNGFREIPFTFIDILFPICLYGEEADADVKGCGETELCVFKTPFYLIFCHVFSCLLIKSDVPLSIIEEGWAAACSVATDAQISTRYWVDGAINLEREN